MHDDEEDKMHESLFAPLRLGGGQVEVSHRVVMAPLTRNRASEPNLCPHGDHVDYYTQRASKGGLLISEAVSISPEAVGYVSVPGIWTTEQVNAWRNVTDAVHKKGCSMFMQLWHTGRVAHKSFGSHPLLRKSGMALPSVSASATRMVHPRSGKPLPTETYVEGAVSETPRALRLDEIPRLVSDYVRAATNAIRAGFDGVEVHAAHGYLIDQFLQDGVNKRSDWYGGSVKNRCRLLFEVVEAVSRAVGPGKCSVRLSPTTIDPRTGQQNQLYFAASCTEPDKLYAHAVKGLNAYPLAYLLLTEPRWWGGRADGDAKSDKRFNIPLSNKKYRKLYHGVLMAAGGFTPGKAAQAVREGHYDMVAFGRFFISNPDLPERIRRGSPLNVYDRATFYANTNNGGGSDGYTDYPNLTGTMGTQGKYKLIEQSEIGSSLPKSKL